MSDLTAICIDLTGNNPALSLGSYWMARQLHRQESIHWIMSRGGFADLNIPCAPPSGSTTTSALFVGTPLEAVEFHKRMESSGLVVDVFVLGITETTPPVAPALFERFRRVYAGPETAQWLKSWGVEAEDQPLALSKIGKVEERGERLRLAIFGNAPFDKDAVKKFAKIREFNWADQGKPIDMREVVDIAAWADVCITPQRMLDDPVRWVLDTYRVMCVCSDPEADAVERMMVAAKHKRAGTFAPLDVLRECAQHSGGGTARLGVVVPFGGLPVEGLGRMLQMVTATAPEGTPVVVSHQIMPDLSPDEDAKQRDEVEDVCNEMGAGLRVSVSPGGWRLGSARNEGVKGMPDDVTHIAFLDADILVDEAFFKQVEKVGSKFGDVVMVPHVKNSGGSVRYGTGVAVYPRKPFDRAGGFSEDFEGWGYEDLELLKRLRYSGTPAMLLDSSADPLLFHVDHEARWEDTRTANYERWLSS